MRNAAFILFLAACGPALAQHGHSGYAGLQDRAIPALSADEVSDLREGRGMGASLPAELNGVPGPLHVLELKDRLHVTPEQAAALGQITNHMKMQAQTLGAKIIEAEAALDLAFKKGAADENAIRAATAQIASLRGQLRAVHLIAHLQTKQLLSHDQVVAYSEARGYAPSGHEQPQHQHH
jgi:hypothetical protein